MYDNGLAAAKCIDYIVRSSIVTRFNVISSELTMHFRETLSCPFNHQLISMQFNFYSTSILAVCLLFAGCSNSSDSEINYLNQTPPGTTPEVFAPGVISMPGQSEFGSIFSDDGIEFYFGVDIEGRAEIRRCLQVNGQWSDPEVLVSHKEYSYNDPFLSPDQQTLYFISNSPISGEGPLKDYDIWYMEREGVNWSDPIRASGAINTDGDEYYISIADNNRLYFASNVAADTNRKHDFDIYSSKLVDGTYSEAFKLGGAANSRAYEADVFIAPDESYLIFSSVRRGGAGRGDLYISFKNDDGSSTEAINMGPKINTANHELCPFVTPDGKYFFYSSNEDIYWVDAEILTLYKK